jgi:hypothetical protein
MRPNFSPNNEIVVSLEQQRIIGLILGTEWPVGGFQWSKAGIGGDDALRGRKVELHPAPVNIPEKVNVQLLTRELRSVSVIERFQFSGKHQTEFGWLIIRR